MASRDFLLELQLENRVRGWDLWRNVCVCCLCCESAGFLFEAVYIVAGLDHVRLVRCYSRYVVCAIAWLLRTVVCTFYIRVHDTVEQYTVFLGGVGEGEALSRAACRGYDPRVVRLAFLGSSYYPSAYPAIYLASDIGACRTRYTGHSRVATQRLRATTT